MLINQKNGGEDFDQMLDAIGKNITPFRAYKGEGGPAFRWAIEFSSTENLTLMNAEYGSEWTFEPGGTVNAFNILVPRQGSAELALGTKKHVVSPGFLSFSQSHCVSSIRPFIGHDRHAGAVLVIESGTFFRTISAYLERPVSGHIDILPAIDTSNDSGRLLSNIVGTIVSGLSGSAPLAYSPLGTSLLTEALIRLVLDTVPNRYSSILSRKASDVAPRHVKWAIEFMYANLRRPITLADIAEASGVSTRSLEAGFRNFKETSPFAYLRQLRLAAARRDLTDPESIRPVSEVALKWGFAHLGRFSAYYRLAFGEFPSETVKQQRKR